METLDILEIASKLGYSIGLEIGAESFVELELSYATRLLPIFSDNPLIRIRQHLLFYRSQGFLKSTIVDEFAKTVPEILRVTNVTSMTPQTIFGSITDDKKSIVQPILAHSAFVKVDELASFVGTGNNMRDIVNTLNTAMEGKPISRYLLKLGQPDFDKKNLEKLRQEGISYNPNEACITFQPDFIVWASSRPLDNRTYTYLRRSGHLGRYHVIQSEVTESQAERLFKENLQPDMKMLDNLRILNENLSKIQIKEICSPPEEMFEQVLSRLKEIINEENRDERVKLTLAEIIEPRSKGNIQREIASHAFLRTAFETNFEAISRLEYTDSDLKFILSRLDHFIEFKLNPLFVEDFSVVRTKKKRPRDQAKEIILQLLKDQEVHKKEEIDQHINSQISLGGATIANALTDLVSDEEICQPRYGYYKFKEDCVNCQSREICSEKTANK
jgi:hypothetical protein